MHDPARPLPAISLAVVGAPYPNKDGSSRRFEIAMCKPGDPVELQPEPKNRHDEGAVAVLSSRGVQIGYLTAERCRRMGALMHAGRELRAVFQAPANFGAWIRVAFDGDEPVINAAESTAAADAEPDFYPDEIWPDE